jgi:hypothetical protein
VRIPKTEYRIHLLFDDNDASSREFDLLALNSVPRFQSGHNKVTLHGVAAVAGVVCLSVVYLPVICNLASTGILNCQDPLNRYGRDLIVDDDVQTQARRLFCEVWRPISLICKSTKRFSESLTSLDDSDSSPCAET